MIVDVREITMPEEETRLKLDPKEKANSLVDTHIVSDVHEVAYFHKLGLIHLVDWEHKFEEEDLRRIKNTPHEQLTFLLKPQEMIGLMVVKSFLSQAVDNSLADRVRLVQQPFPKGSARFNPVERAAKKREFIDDYVIDPKVQRALQELPTIKDSRKKRKAGLTFYTGLYEEFREDFCEQLRKDRVYSSLTTGLEIICRPPIFRADSSRTEDFNPFLFKLGVNLALRALGKTTKPIENDYAIGTVLADELDDEVCLTITEKEAKTQPLYRWAKERYQGKGELRWGVGLTEIVSELKQQKD